MDFVFILLIVVLYAASHWLVGAISRLGSEVGLYMANVFEGRPIWPVRIAARLESLIYRVCGIDPAAQMSGIRYAVALLVFNALGALLVYAGSLRVCIKNLRGKLEPDPRKPRHLVTEAGLGYRLRDELRGE